MFKEPFFIPKPQSKLCFAYKQNGFYKGSFDNNR